MHVEGNVADQRDHLGVLPNLIEMSREVFTELRRECVEMGIDRVEIAVLVDQLGRGLLPDPGHARQVVGRIAAQRGEQRVLLGADTGPCLDSRLVVERVVAHTLLVVEHTDKGVLDQLIRVAVTGHDDHRQLVVTRLGGECGEHVVGLEALDPDHRDGQ